MNRASAVLLAVLAGFFFVSCRVDKDVLRAEANKQLSGAERLFLAEEGSDRAIRDDMEHLVRDAVRHGHVNVLRYLRELGADLNKVDEDGWSPILISSLRGDLPMVRFLVESAGADVRAKNRDRSTALMLASESGNTDLVRFLLEYGANPNSKSVTGLTALMYACASDRIDTVKVLLERGADINARDVAGNTAREYSSSAAVKALLAGNQEAQP